MHRVILAALLAVALPAAAQRPKLPPDLEPVPEPPPAIGFEVDQNAPGPTIAPGAQVKEFTTPDGKKYIHVIEQNGAEYYLVEELPGEPAGARTSNFDSGVRVPMWVILQW